MSCRLTTPWHEEGGPAWIPWWADGDAGDFQRWHVVFYEVADRFWHELVIGTVTCRVSCVREKNSVKGEVILRHESQEKTKWQEMVNYTLHIPHI